MPEHRDAERGDDDYLEGVKVLVRARKVARPAPGRLPVTIGALVKPTSVAVSQTDYDNADVVIGAGFAGSFSEAVRVALAALAHDIRSERALLVRAQSTARQAAPRSEARPAPR